MSETGAVPRIKRKNPALRTRLPTGLPAQRSRAALGLTAAAAEGVFALQVCSACGAVQYPPRDACRVCLSAALVWRRQNGTGELLSETMVRYGQELYFRERGAWRIGLVRLDAGVSVVAHLHESCPAAPHRVRVFAALDRVGQAALVAGPLEGNISLADDSNLREMTCDPRGRKVLVTDAKTPVGQAIVRNLIKAGAEVVWAGHAEPWKIAPGFESLQADPRVALVPLDVTNSRNVTEIAGEVGAKIDILVNTASYRRVLAVTERQGVETARAELDVNYLGLLRLIQAFGPIMQARGADGPNGAVAWVNILSVFALTNFPSQGTFSASMAGALSLSQAWRAEAQAAGIRVINVLPGPIDDEWSQTILPPKLAPDALAKAVIEALRGSIEDVYPGPIAEDWLARWTDNPKALEREQAR